jgi:signal transduction histidine kinase/ActR/RegA family two-component response regulator
VIARYPALPNDQARLPPGGSFLTSIAKSPARGLYESPSAFDGVERIIAYRSLEDYPVYVIAAYDRAFITRQWLRTASSHLLFGIPATAALFLITMTALRRTRREASALAELHAESLRREETESRLRQAQKMEAVGRLTGGIAHDFNNLLTIVIGSLDLLLRRLVDGDDRARQLAQNALQGATRAATLTLRLLAFSRQQPLDPKSLEINKLVGSMSELLRSTLGETIKIETVLAGGLWQTFIDANQLESAILNLAVNARDAMPTGGKLTIESANAHLDEFYASNNIEVAAGQYVVVSISDTGGGMSPDVVAKAFDPFFTTKPAGQGTGLGLSQVYGFMKQSGGHVKIYSEVGQGTTVKLYFPRYYGGKPEGIAPASQSEPANTNSAGTILVVEDDDAVRDFAASTLRELGYRTLDAAAPSAALRLLDNHADIALLLTDVVMPESNGRALAEEAVKRRPGLKVLYMTGYTRNAIVHNNMLDPATHLISKPFTVRQLGAKVQELLAGSTSK